MMLLENDVETEEKTSATYQNSFGKLQSTIKNRLLLADEGFIKIVTAGAISTLLPTDPVWVLIVAGPGGAKTEIIRGLNSLDFVFPINDLTPQTFLSGDKNNSKGSLLHRLPSPALITMKDFTSVLEMNSDKQRAILSQLREIYDGEYSKEFGTGESKAWHGKIGFIAGVTQVIDKHQANIQTLGERWIKYYPVQSEPLELAKRALSNSGDEVAMRSEIQQAFKDYIEGLEIPEKLDGLPEHFKDAIIHLATFCAIARSAIIRDGKTREIEYVPEPEHPTRLVKQLSNLFQSLAIISGDFTNEDYGYIYKIGMDSLPMIRRQIVDYLYNSGSPQTLLDILTAIKRPKPTVGRQIEELVLLDVLRSSGRSSIEYELHPQAKVLLDHAFMIATEPFSEISVGVSL